jgi:predicted ATPase
VQLVTERVPSFDAYPFSIPAVAALKERLRLGIAATIFVGDNGSGKSTLVEAIAVASGYNAEGGTRNFHFGTRASESALCRCIRLSRTDRRPRTGFFLRAESFFNLATNVEELDSEPGLSPLVIESYGGRSLHEQSHGESFFALVRQRFGPQGLYVLDEPEAPLSVRGQIELVAELRAHVEQKGSQIIMATHSPILMSLPNALIYQMDRNGIAPVKFEHTDAFRLMRDFISSA